MSNSDLERAAELAAERSRTAGTGFGMVLPPKKVASPMDEALVALAEAIKNRVSAAEAADIAVADQQQAILADLARREHEGRL